MRLAALLAAALLSACAVPLPPDCAPAPDSGVAWVVDKGWHTEIGLRADELTGPLASFRDVFPGATYIMFGFGKRTFITARVRGLSELILGPVPGPGALEIVAIAARPDQAFTGLIEAVRLTPAQRDKLSDFLWGAFAKTESGAPKLIGDGLFPGSLFYESARPYNIAYTCNTWTADALHAAGADISATAVVFSQGVMAQLGRQPNVCRAPA